MVKSGNCEFSSQFGENVLDATQAWNKFITDASELAALPESALAHATSKWLKQKAVICLRWMYSVI